MWSRQKGFEPEVYLKKAEADIQAVQMQCSLAEPAWDGFCGLVLLNEDDLAQEGPESRDPEQHDAELTEEEHSNDKQRWQQQLVSRITQQIKGISSVPASSRGELLQNLADEALAASKECTPQVAKQLLTLADFAGSKKAAQWQGPSKSAGAEAPLKSTGAIFQDPPSEAAPDRGNGALPEGQSATEANKHFKSAIDLVKRGKLQEALQQFEYALALCPLERKVAHSKIEAHIGAVRAELKTKPGSWKAPQEEDILAL